MLVFETRRLRRDAWKPKLGFRFGPRSLSSSIFCLWGHLSACLNRGSCSACVGMPLLAKVAYTIGMASGALEVSPNLEGCGHWNGQNFL